MCERLCFVCKNTCRCDSACCKLLKVIGYVILVIVCIAGAYFTLVGIGQLEKLFSGIWCNKDNQDSNGGCWFFWKGIDTNPFGLGFLMGLLVCVSLVVSCILCLVIGKCLCCTFEKPCSECKKNWKASKQMPKQHAHQVVVPIAPKEVDDNVVGSKDIGSDNNV